VPRDHARSFVDLYYQDPRIVLVEFRKIQLRMATSGMSYKERSLRTNALKSERDAITAHLFCYGMEQVTGQKRYVAKAEGQDYDAVAMWIDGDNQNFAPIQVKELVPEELNPATSLQELIDKLPKYADSDDLTVVIRLNRQITFTPAELKLPKGLRIAALWAIAALSDDLSEWGLCGDLLETTECRYFQYPG
jgi:hypothetical protein